jgi:hypothetical protein
MHKTSGSAKSCTQTPLRALKNSQNISFYKPCRPTLPLRACTSAPTWTSPTGITRRIVSRPDPISKGISTLPSARVAIKSIRIEHFQARTFEVVHMHPKDRARIYLESEPLAHDRRRMVGRDWHVCIQVDASRKVVEGACRGAIFAPATESMLQR